jgi:hypothetical protein
MITLDSKGHPIKNSSLQSTQRTFDHQADYHIKSNPNENQILGKATYLKGTKGANASKCIIQEVPESTQVS